MNTQHQISYSAISPYMMTRNGSSTSLPDDDAPFGYDTKAAQHWDSYLQASFRGVHEDSQMFNYESSAQQSFLMSNWVSEDQDDTTTTHVVNLNAASLPKQLPEARVQPGAVAFGKTNVQKNFVRKLFDMLSDESAQPYIYWNSDGKSFVIEKQEEFAKKVLKRYLKTENFQSFIRQLNMYDFHKINRAQRAQRGVQAQAPQFVFSHQKFQRDSPELLSEIKRKGAEPQDAPPSYETLSSAGKPLLGMPTSTQPLVAAQPELRDILVQMEFQRMRDRIASLEAENNSLKGERDALKASLQVRTAVSMPQVPQVSAPSTTTYQHLYSGNLSNKAPELNRSGHLFESDYPVPTPEPTEAPVLFQTFTGITPQNNTNQVAGPSHVSLDSTPIPIRRRLSNAPTPDMGSNNQPAPQQSQGQSKARPSSWYKWLGFQGVGTQSEAGPSTASNTFHQDTHPTNNTNYGKGVPRGRADPVAMTNRRQQY